MAKRYKTVLDLVKNVSDDKAFQSELKEEIISKSLAKALFAMRCSKGITQEEMARRLGCSQGKISKLENSTVEHTKVSDIVAYAKAMKLQLSICFHDRLTATEWIKFHVFEIRRHLDHLAKLAHEDQDIEDGVRGFIKDTIYNFFRMIKKSTDLLPAQPRTRQSQVLEVCPPTVMEQEEQEFEEQQKQLLSG